MLVQKALPSDTPFEELLCTPAHRCASKNAPMCPSSANIFQCQGAVRILSKRIDRFCSSFFIKMVFYTKIPARRKCRRVCRGRSWCSNTPGRFLLCMSNLALAENLYSVQLSLEPCSTVLAWLALKGLLFSVLQIISHIQWCSALRCRNFFWAYSQSRLTPDSTPVKAWALDFEHQDSQSFLALSVLAAICPLLPLCY